MIFIVSGLTEVAKMPHIHKLLYVLLILTKVCGKDACKDGHNHWDQVCCEAARTH